MTEIKEPAHNFDEPITVKQVNRANGKLSAQARDFLIGGREIISHSGRQRAPLVADYFTPTNEKAASLLLIDFPISSG